MENQTTGALRIRPATRADVPLILEYIRRLARYEKSEDQVAATEESLAYWMFEREKSQAVFGEVDGETVGFALFFYNFSTFTGRCGIFLEDIFLDPEHRGKGYGKKMLCHVAAFARAEACARMEWRCLDWNTPSIEFYLSLGAQPMSEWTTYRLSGDTLEAAAAYGEG